MSDIINRFAIKAAIKVHFPEATDVEVREDGTAEWKFKERTYILSPWRITAYTDKEDWGTFGCTVNDVMTNASAEDWSDHGFMLNMPMEEADKMLQTLTELNNTD